MRLLTAILFLAMMLTATADPTLIGHADMPPLDRMTVQRIYTGRIVELAGVRVTPVDLPVGNPIRERFLHQILDQDEDKYTGYWTVRRYVGKGTPPRVLGTSAEVLEFVTRTVGAVGYVDETDASPQLNVLLRAPR